MQQQDKRYNKTRVFVLRFLGFILLTKEDKEAIKILSKKMKKNFSKDIYNNEIENKLILKIMKQKNIENMTSVQLNRIKQLKLKNLK